MSKLVCGDGDDCPCYTAEKTRPVLQPLQKAPNKVTVEAGKTAYTCACGLSKNFPYCDGSHQAYNATHGTKLAPIFIKNEGTEPKDFYLCMCGHSKNRPFCDGSHKKLREVVLAAAPV